MPNDALIEQLLRRIIILERWRDQLVLPEIEYPVLIQVSVANVNTPPTDAQIDALFGTPAVAGAGFIAVITDIIDDPNEYRLVISNGTVWVYEQLTLAA